MNSKRGSSAVFLMMILTALISVTLIMIYGIREECIRSRIDGVLNLAGNSVMSEYDLDVREEYGLFMIMGRDDMLEERLHGYMDYSLSDMDGVNIETINISGERFSATDTELIKAQILEYMKLAIAEDSLDTKEDDTEVFGNDMENKVLRHGPTAVSLPSVTIPQKSLTVIATELAANTEKISEVFKTGTETYMLDRYILNKFNRRTDAVDKDHFFKNEVEYILGGEESDIKNEKRVEMALKAMRFPLNLAYIYADPKKRSATLAMAEILTPGAAAAATQAVLASTWAYAEADNDVELLWQGYRVPVIKDEGSWAVELNNAVEGILKGPVMPAEEKGYDYDRYLRILMFFQDEDIKISRILDLIQINIRTCRDREFLIGEHVLGIDIEAVVNNRSYGYEKKY